MKKHLIRVLACVLVLVMAAGLVACGGSGKTEATKATLSLNHVGATTHPYQIGAEKFAELVAEKSGGNITIDVFPASQIASGAKAIEFVQMGTLDIAVESTLSLATAVPEIDTLNLPFLFDDAEQAFRILDGEPGKALEKKCEEQGFKILAWW